MRLQSHRHLAGHVKAIPTTTTCLGTSQHAELPGHAAERRKATQSTIGRHLRPTTTCREALRMERSTLPVGLWHPHGARQMETCRHDTYHGKEAVRQANHYCRPTRKQTTQSSLMLPTGVSSKDVRRTRGGTQGSPDTQTWRLPIIDGTMAQSIFEWQHIEGAGITSTAMQ